MKGAVKGEGGFRGGFRGVEGAGGGGGLWGEREW
jgi:hypothetical protein